MNTRNLILILLSAAALALTSCDRNPGWDGHRSSNAPEEAAEETCKCVYEVMSGFEEFDVDVVLELADKIQPRGAGVDDGEGRDYEVAYAMKLLILDKVDASECMKPVEDAIFNKGLDYDDVQHALLAHCKLAPFYEF